MAGFQNMKAVHMGEDPTAASIPFDARRSGFVMGEGAGCLVLESMTHAQQRGATILAEVAGYGASGDAYHITSPSPDGDAAAHAIRGAIEDAGLTRLTLTISTRTAPRPRSTRSTKPSPSKRRSATRLTT